MTLPLSSQNFLALAPRERSECCDRNSSLPPSLPAKSTLNSAVLFFACRRRAVQNALEYAAAESIEMFVFLKAPLSLSVARPPRSLVYVRVRRSEGTRRRRRKCRVTRARRKRSGRFRAAAAGGKLYSFGCRIFAERTQSFFSHPPMGEHFLRQYNLNLTYLLCLERT